MHDASTSSYVYAVKTSKCAVDLAYDSIPLSTKADVQQT